MDLKLVKKAAKEFNEVVPLDFPVDVKSANLEKELYEALSFIEDGDEFTDGTLALFAELKAKFDAPKGKSKKEKKMEKKSKHETGKKEKPEIENDTVEIGDTVELDVDADVITKTKGMKEEIGNAGIISTILDRKVTKDTLTGLIENEKVFKKAKKDLLKVANYMSLKKQMLEVFDEKEVEAVKAVVAETPAPAKKAKAVSKPKVEDPMVNSIKSAFKVKQLKKLAKENDQFNWKKLKKLEFDEMQKAMLAIQTKGAKAEPAKPKMVPNPLVAEITGFDKMKKLVKWAKEMDEFKSIKKMKKMGLDELKVALTAAIPAQIESKSTGKRVVRNTIDQAARTARVTGLIKEGTHTRKEIHEILKSEFPEVGKAHTNSNILSECKNPDRWERFGNFGGLVVENEKGHYVFADSIKPEKKDKVKKDKSKKKGKKDKKNRK